MQLTKLSPLLFIMIMDCLTEDIRRECPSDMVFADDMIPCAEMREEVERVKWRHWR